MAKALRVNGIEVPVLADSASHMPKPFDEDERAEDASLLISRRALKESWKLTIAHRVPTDAIAWKKLLMGEGHSWDFEASTGLYSSKGLGPSAATNSVQSASGAKFGAGCMRQTATSGTVTFTALPAGGTKWTVMFWRDLNAGGGWHHYVVNSAGQKWLDGVRADATSTTFLTVNTSAGTVKLDAGGTNTDIDDLVILPFDVPTTWPPDSYAFGAAFSKLGRLTIDGDLVEANVGSKTVVGKVGSLKVMPAVLNGVYYQSVRTLDVELEEV